MPEGPYRIDGGDDGPPGSWRVLGWLLLGFAIAATLTIWGWLVMEVVAWLDGLGR